MSTESIDSLWHSFIGEPFVLDIDPTGRRISVSGELDLATAPQLLRAGADLIALSGGDVTIDLAGVTFIGASGLGALVGLIALQGERAALHIIGNARVLRVAGLVGLTSLLVPLLAPADLA